MSNHVHLAIEEGDVRLSKIMQVLQSSYTQWFNRRHRRVGHLFQGRFKSYLVDGERYLLSLLRYIHENPVRSGMVERPEDYSWSSDRYFRTGRGPHWLDLDRILAMLAPTRAAAVSRYRRLLREATDEAYERLSAIQGTVKGDEAFALRFMGSTRELIRPRPGWTAARIVRSVAASRGIPIREVLGASRRRDATKTRIIAAHVGRSRFGITVAEFARLYRREESTLRRGVLSLEQRLAVDSDLRRLLAGIELRDSADETTRLHV
jgi:REP-associated tyrosine transposase